MEQKKWVVIYSYAFQGGSGNGHSHALGDLTPEFRQMIRDHLIDTIIKNSAGRHTPSAITLSITGIYQLAESANYA